MALCPRIEPYSETVTFGYFSRPTHLPPIDGNVEHVRAMFSAEQLQSASAQMPSFDSREHARYGFWVSYERPEPVLREIECIHWYGPSIEPPWHEPALPQLRMCYTDRLMSMPLAPRAILMRSPSAETAPWAQHEPQYCGMCWFRLIVQ